MQRGFFVAEGACERHYLIPVGLMSGAKAQRAVAAGAALPLRGGPLAFAGLEVARRASGGMAARAWISLDAAQARYPALIAQLSSPLTPWAGFNIDRPLIMGVLNVTPDSFSDGGDFLAPDRALAQGEKLLAAGADILDVGGESTRPGAAPVSPQEELARVIPVIEVLARRGAVVSIDTRHAAVMRAALAAGAAIINDVTALTGDAESLDVAAGTDAGLVLMHMQGVPAEMQTDPRYDDTVPDLLDYFDARLEVMAARGVARARITIDPGIGFGKTMEHNLDILRNIAAFHVFGCPIVLGTSRKSLIGRLSRNEPPQGRLAGSLALSSWGFAQGVQIHRVHDVAEAVQARSVWQAVAKEC